MSLLFTSLISRKTTPILESVAERSATEGSWVAEAGREVLEVLEVFDSH